MSPRPRPITRSHRFTLLAIVAAVVGFWAVDLLADWRRGAATVVEEARIKVRYERWLAEAEAKAREENAEPLGAGGSAS